MKRNYLLFILLFIFSSCQKEDDNNDDQIDFKYNYAPLAVGQISIFQIDSILYDDFNNSIDTVSLQRKEEIVSTFIDGTGKTAFRIELSRRLNDSLAWQLIRVFSSYRDDLRYVKTDNNIPIVLLVFPPKKSKEWDGNLFNTKPEIEFTYTAIDVADTIENISFNEVLSVLQEDELNRIQEFYTEEKYARNIGLVYRVDKQLETDLDGEIRNGYESIQKIISFTPGNPSL